MSSYPVRFDDPLDLGLTGEQLALAQSHEANTVLEVHRQLLWSRALAESERFDALAAADAQRTCLETELALLRDGLALAGQSVAGVELVARSVELLARVNERRFLRRFGG
jgi:hypothetical protein